MQSPEIDNTEWEEFQNWKTLKSSQLDKTFWELEKVLNRAIGRNYNETMPNQAFRVLAHALIALRNEVVKK